MSEPQVDVVTLSSACGPGCLCRVPGKLSAFWEEWGPRALCWVPGLSALASLLLEGSLGSSLVLSDSREGSLASSPCVLFLPLPPTWVTWRGAGLEHPEASLRGGLLAQVSGSHLLQLHGTTVQVSPRLPYKAGTSHTGCSLEPGRVLGWVPAPALSQPPAPPGSVSQGAEGGVVGALGSGPCRGVSVPPCGTVGRLSEGLGSVSAA